MRQSWAQHHVTVPSTTQLQAAVGSREMTLVTPRGSMRRSTFFYDEDLGSQRSRHVGHWGPLRDHSGFGGGAVPSLSEGEMSRGPHDHHRERFVADFARAVAIFGILSRCSVRPVVEEMERAAIELCSRSSTAFEKMCARLEQLAVHFLDGLDNC